jgi:ssRNA-specific RNase YbeY (16S rRNA maturation enzyme)
MKDKVLGKKYELSLVFIGDKKSLSLNKQFRKKNHIANVLSFPIDADLGEIFINYPNAKKEAKK